MKHVLFIFLALLSSLFIASTDYESKGFFEPLMSPDVITILILSTVFYLVFVLAYKKLVKKAG